MTRLARNLFLHLFTPFGFRGILGGCYLRGADSYQGCVYPPLKNFARGLDTSLFCTTLCFCLYLLLKFSIQDFLFSQKKNGTNFFKSSEAILEKKLQIRKK